jgi:hypothetical protein
MWRRRRCTARKREAVTNADRTERIRALSKLSLGILHRCGDRCYIDRAGGRFRIVEIRHNEFRLTYSRSVDDGEGRTSTLDVRYLGHKVLSVEWTIDKVLRTSYRPGDWEALLRRYDRAPVLAIALGPMLTG